MRRDIAVFGCTMEDGRVISTDKESIVSVRVFPDRSVKITKPDGSIERIEGGSGEVMSQDLIKWFEVEKEDYPTLVDVDGYKVSEAVLVYSSTYNLVLIGMYEGGGRWIGDDAQSIPSVTKWACLPHPKDDWPDESRIDVIGSNGNTGDHYV